MTDLYAGEREFDGLDPERRGAIFMKAMDIIQEHSLAGAGVLFLMKEFEAVAPLWPLRFGSAYSAGCQLALQAAGDWLNTHGYHTLVRYTFESGHKFRAEADAMLKANENDPKARGRCRYHSHTFAGKGEALGLQAADILAWLITKAQGGGKDVKPRVRRAFFPSASPIETSPDKYRVLFLSGRKLETFLREQFQSTADLVRTGPRKRTFR